MLVEIMERVHKGLKCNFGVVKRTFLLLDSWFLGNQHVLYLLLYIVCVY